MVNTTYENKNPCIGCKISWCAEGSLSCHDTCEKYQIYRDRQTLIDCAKKVSLEFEKLDELREVFLSTDDFDVWQIQLIYKVFEFIKREY